jgi:hypothetical protein
MWREQLRRTRIARSLADFCGLALIVGAGIFVVAWSAERGPAMIGRMVAWSSARAASRPPQPVKLGARKRAYFDLVKKEVKAESCPPPADPP